MPHQCTDCGRAFGDGSKEMLSGCPDCGGTTFQFRPGGDGDGEPSTPSEPPEPPEPPEAAADNTVTRTVGNAATAVRDLVGGSSPPDSTDLSPESPGTDGEPIEQESPSRSTGTPAAGEQPPAEDVAQASARSDVVPPEELPSAPESSTRERPAPVMDDTAEDHDRPDLSELREELNQQFESIRVLEPGQYELNLMELFDREEYIIALQEDGKYTIQVPERWED